MPEIRIRPCLDDEALADGRRSELVLPPGRALDLARETLETVRAGAYRTPAGRIVSIRDAVDRARRASLSLGAADPLPARPRARFGETWIQVTNETTLGAARRLIGEHRTVALNFANAFVPGGGFLVGACAQEESLCRASALYDVLSDDAMYEVHATSGDPAASDHAILSPDVPFFRDDRGEWMDEPCLLSVLTCAAPIAPEVGDVRAAQLLRARIERVLDIVAAYGYEAVVLGAWGCGAFGNDTRTTAESFRDALLESYKGAFREVVFAVADWSRERHTLGAFREVFRA